MVEPVSISPYPQEVKIAFDGSILSLRGSREVAFLSRGVSELRASVARIDASDLNHLTTQTSGDFSHPYFINYNFNEDNISEIFEKSLKNAANCLRFNENRLCGVKTHRSADDTKPLFFDDKAIENAFRRVV